LPGQWQTQLPSASNWRGKKRGRVLDNEQKVDENIAEFTKHRGCQMGVENAESEWAKLNEVSLFIEEC